MTPTVLASFLVSILLVACHATGYKNPCKAKPCKFGGICTAQEDSDEDSDERGFVCECRPGHEGETCETPNDQCEFDPHARTDCGHPGIPEHTCRAKNCCWDKSIRDVKWCFYPKNFYDTNK